MNGTSLQANQKPLEKHEKKATDHRVRAYLQCVALV